VPQLAYPGPPAARPPQVPGSGPRTITRQIGPICAPQPLTPSVQRLAPNGGYLRCAYRLSMNAIDQFRELKRILERVAPQSDLTLQTAPMLGTAAERMSRRLTELVQEDGVPIAAKPRRSDLLEEHLPDSGGYLFYSLLSNVGVHPGAGEVLDTVELDRGCFACALGGPDRSTLFMIATEWNGPANMFHGPRTGQVLTTQAPAPGAGWP
jgi:hypothetical protein